MIPSFKISEDEKILELISKAPGNFFALNSPNEIILPARFYKDKRADFWKDAKSLLNSELTQNGTFIIMNGTTRKVKPIISLQKGDKNDNPAPVIVMEERSDIALVKENAELKAKLHYLELQLAELQENLEDAETTLDEAPEVTPEKNPWLSLAEQLAPAAGQILGAIAAKYLQPTPTQTQTPQQYAPIYRTPTGGGYNSANAMESRNFGRNAEPDFNPVQSEGFNSSGDV
jgi:hypothetical protein